MTSPNRSVVVRLALDPSSYIAGASRAEGATLSLDRAVSKVGPSSATSMEQAAKGAGTAEGAMGRLNKTAGALGFTLGGLAGVGGAIAAALSVKWAGDYQQALTKLATTAGESQKNLGRVGQGMLDMAGQVGIGADELSKAMYTVDSANFHGADSLTVLKAAAQGARQEQADLSHVVDAVTTSLHDYHLPASDAANVTSQLIAAVSHGKVTFDDLTGAMHSVEPIAASAGLSIAQTAGALAAMTASGMHADQAAQNLASSIRSFEKPTGTMRDELYQLGLDAQDLSAHLGDRGIAGTLQMVSEAIVNKMGPAGQVALSALNQNKAAAQDLGVMLSNMPPALAQLSQGLLDGTVNQRDFRKAAIDLGGTAGPMADQFLQLYKSSNGFSQILKTGGPAVQTYIGALGKAVGTAEGLSVALQLTGDNAAATNKTIGDVANAAAQADGNIKGWNEVQGNFNQQLAQTEAHAKSLAIEAGQHLLPILSSGLGWINSTGIPAIEHLGSAVGDAAHVWSQLPGPIKDATLALAGLGIAEKIGLLGKLGDGAGKVGGAFTSMSSQMTTAFSAAKANQVRLVEESASLWGTSTAASRAAAGATTGLWASTATEVDKAGAVIKGSTGNLAGLGAAAGAAAKGGLAALKSGASGLMNMFGGPWGLALVGATLGVTALMDAVARHDAEIQKATADVQKWNETISLGGSGQSAIQAQTHLEDLRQKLAGVTAEIDRYNAAAQGGYARGGIGTLVSQQAELRGELDKGSKAWKDQLASMTPVEEATARVQIAEHDLQMVRKTNPDNSQAVINAEIRLQGARESLTGETDRANASEKTRIQRLQDSANAALGLVDANRQAMEASLNLTQQVSDYNKQIADGTLKGDALKSATLGIVDSAEQAAKAAGDAAAQQAKQNGATDTGAASQAGFMKSLQDAASTMSGPARKALEDYIAQLGGQQTQAQLTAGAINGLGVQVTDLPSSHLITINVPTDDQMKKLHDLGYATATLPDGHVVVTADTNPAQAEIQGLLNYARQQSINYRATLPDLNGSASGTGRMGTYAAGGYTGPGAKYTPAGIVHAGEFVMPQESVDRLGVGFLGALAGLPGYATGGWVNVPQGGAFMGSASIPVHVLDAGYMAGIHQYAANFSPPYNPSAGVEQWRGLVDQVLRMLGISTSADNGVLSMIAHESGGNPRAINLTDSNAAAGHPSQGLMQTIPGTFYAYAGPYAGRGITDPLANIYAGVNYALHRYGFGMLASGGRRSASGGYLGYETGTDFVPETGPAVLHKGEAVLTKEQNEARRAVRSREFVGAGAGAMVVQHTDARSYPIAVTAGESAQSIVREIRTSQYQQDFLNG